MLTLMLPLFLCLMLCLATIVTSSTNEERSYEDPTVRIRVVPRRRVSNGEVFFRPCR